MTILSKEGLWALAEYRFNHWIHYHFHVPILRQFLIILGVICHKLIMLITGIELPKQAEIGSGLYIAHMGCIVLHPNVELGDNCTISQDVTIGLGGRGDKLGSPKIGDRVYIAPGAKIFGKITIGNDVAIGANAVVTKDLPDKAVAAGVPAKIISYKGSKDFI
ncbi:MAG: serine O-acetyltransferase [Xenococcaceae cyanobacterium MO_167.B52]|nr:serine O-acetyltransferase [Xenococcaceae cyanobacterium MO_167.B52]